MIVNFKNILIGLLVLGFFGLIYAFLGSSPEMVADKRLIVEEEPLQTPSFRAEQFSGDTLELSTELDNAVLADDEVIQSAESVNAELATNVSSEPEALGLIDRSATSDINPFAADEGYANIEAPEAPEAPEAMAEAAVVPELETVLVIDESGQVADAMIAEAMDSPELASVSTTDVAVIPSPDEFIDLNLVEEEPLEMVLLEGDELIMDDVNEEMGKYKAIVESFAQNEEVKNIALASEEASAPVTDVTNPFAEKEVMSIATPIVIPEVDEALMLGEDPISLEYQSTMAKLLDVKQQMVEADAENARLKARFSSVVNQNRELAILIKDIDIKIKSLTAAN
ncbi:hypothetical protein EOL70_14110 [Leucothrix sargassi]|nr:hypothetical protein EOL70_14110 [Leucothrix sargassi]